MGIKVTIEIELDDGTDPALNALVRDLIRLGAHGGRDDISLRVAERPKQKRRPPKKTRFRVLTATNGIHSAKPIASSQGLLPALESAYPEAVTIDVVVQQLGLLSGKTLGGLTGALRRWSTLDVVRLPWMQETVNGRRAWRWLGFDNDGRLRSRASTKAPSADGDAYWHQMPPRSQAFLEAVRRRGTATVKDILKDLGVDDPRALGGISGSIRRWSQAAGVAPPYENIRIDGQRAFRWIMD